MSSLKSKLAAAGLAVAAFTALPATADAQTRSPNVLVMTEDADKESVPRNNRMMKRVYDSMRSALMNKGYMVYDETIVTKDFVKAQGVRREDTELIDIARSVTRPPIDIVVTYELYAVVRQHGAKERPMYRVQARIAGRAYNVRTGQFLGNWDSDTYETAPLPSNCGADRHCLLETVGEETRIMGDNLADAIADRIRIGMQGRGAAVQPGGGGAGPGPMAGGPGVGPGPMAGGQTGRAADGCEGLVNEWGITLEGFSSAEITAVEEYLASFRCYMNHRVIPGPGGARAQYWYTTRSDDARLARNLRLMLEHMGVEGRVEYSQSAQRGTMTFRVRKVN